MGKNDHDPVDHFRTTHQHAGESLIDGYCWPGLVSIALGVIAFVSCIASVAYNEREYTLMAGVIAVLAIGFGALWIVLEHRRVRQMESRWLAQHSGRHPDIGRTSI
jgi:hypothetical protein